MPREKKPKQGWRADPRKRKRYIIRALKIARKTSLNKIAKWAGVVPATVHKINQSGTPYGPIRDQSTTQEIGKQASAATRREKRKKISCFSREQKIHLLEKNKGLLWQVALEWFTKKGHRSTLIRREFTTPQNLVDSMKYYVFEQLDYYDPKITGLTGAQTNLATWIYGGAQLFCRGTVTEITKQKEQTHPKFEKLLERGKKITKKETGFLVPKATKDFLQKIGNIPEIYSGATDIETVKQRIIAIARAPECGLSKKEIQVIEQRFNGKTRKEIGKELELTGGRIGQIEARAAKKIQIFLA